MIEDKMLWKELWLPPFIFCSNDMVTINISRPTKQFLLAACIISPKKLNGNSYCESLLIFCLSFLLDFRWRVFSTQQDLIYRGNLDVSLLTWVSWHVLLEYLAKWEKTFTWKNAIKNSMSDWKMILKLKIIIRFYKAKLANSTES